MPLLLQRQLHFYVVHLVPTHEAVQAGPWHYFFCEENATNYIILLKRYIRLTHTYARDRHQLKLLKNYFGNSYLIGLIVLLLLTDTPLNFVKIQTAKTRKSLTCPVK
jgi:hypothetical protein